MTSKKIIIYHPWAHIDPRRVSFMLSHIAGTRAVCCSIPVHNHTLKNMTATEPSESITRDVWLSSLRSVQISWLGSMVLMHIGQRAAELVKPTKCRWLL